MKETLNQQPKKEEYSQPQISFLENAISALFPAMAFRRMWARQGLKDLNSRFNYRAAGHGRFRENWSPTNSTAEITDKGGRDILRARARDLERNSDLAKAAVDAIVRNVIGTGIQPQAATGDEKLDETLEYKFKIWCKAKNCDVTGQLDFFEQQAFLLRRRIYDGEILALKVADKRAKIPMKLQVLEADLLEGDMINAPGSSNYILSGVEVNEYYKPLAYWFKQSSPDGLTIYDPKRIPAEQVIHLYHKTRVGQVRGIPEIVQVMEDIKDTDDYLDAELVAARIAACFAMFITRQGASTPGRQLTDANGTKIDALYPGMIETLLPGEDIKSANPARAAAGVKEFIQIQTRKIAAGTGQSYEVVSRDMSQSNYSSARQNGLEDRKTWVPIQNYMITHFCQPLWEEFVTYCVLSGEIYIKDFWSDPDKYFNALWIAPGWTWIDPLKEVTASTKALEAGITTLKKICAEKGEDWKENLRQRAKEIEFAKELGISIQTTTEAPEKNPNDKETEEGDG
jgi:lambda family phage portal protein